MATKTKEKHATALKPERQWFLLSHRKFQLLLLLSCIVCYGNTVFNNYSLDDDFAVTKNNYVQKGIAGIPDILTHSYLSTNNKSADYRPVASISMALENQFFGNAPHISHFINLLLFAALVLVIFNLLNSVFNLGEIHPLLPFVITAVYAAHPIHTEVVASIKNRDEILSAIFALLAMQYSFYLFKQPEKRYLNALLVALFMLLSLASKVTSILLVPAILTVLVFYGFQKQRSRFIIFSSVMLVLPAVYFITVMQFLKRPNYFYENPLNEVHNFALRLGTALETLIFYVKLMFVPYPLRFYYGYNTLPVISIAHPLALLSLILHAFLLIAGINLFRAKKITGLFILCYLIGIFMYSNLVIIYPGIVSERALLLASLWFISACALGLYNFGKFGQKATSTYLRQRVIIGGSLLLFAAFTWLTIQRNFQWQNLYTLLSSDAEHLQNSTLGNYFYANALMALGESRRDTSRLTLLNEAKKYHERALAVSPDYAEPYFKIGMISEYDLGQNDSAFYYFTKAYAMDSTYLPGQFQLAKSYFLKNDYKKANSLFAPLYEKLPDDTSTLFFYSQSLFLLGDTVNAYKINDQLIKLAPNNYEGYLNKGMFYKISGNRVEASKYLELALKNGYYAPQIFNDLLNYYLATGQQERVNELQKIKGQN